MTKTLRTAFGGVFAAMIAAGCTVTGTGAVTPGASMLPSAGPSSAPSAAPSTTPSASASNNPQTPPSTPSPSASAAAACTINELRPASLFAATFPAQGQPDVAFDVTTWVYLNQTPSTAIEVIATSGPFSYEIETATKTIRIKGRVDATVPNPANPDCAFTMQVGGKAESAVVKVKAPAGTYKVVLENFIAEFPVSPGDGVPEAKQPTATITIQ